MPVIHHRFVRVSVPKRIWIGETLYQPGEHRVIPQHAQVLAEAGCTLLPSEPEIRQEVPAFHGDRQVWMVRRASLHAVNPAAWETTGILAGDIRKNGVRVPLLLSRDLRVLDGARRLIAAKRVGLDTLPCLILDVYSTDASHLAGDTAALLSFPDMDAVTLETRFQQTEQRLGLSPGEAGRRV